MKRSRRQVKKLSKKLAPYFKHARVESYRGDLRYYSQYIGRSNGVFLIFISSDGFHEEIDCSSVIQFAEEMFDDWKSFCGCELCVFSLDHVKNNCPEVARRKKIKTEFKTIKSYLDSDHGPEILGVATWPMPSTLK